LGTIIRVSGPLVVASGMTGCKMYEIVRVGEKKLIGEIIELKSDTAAIQVYEETTGIGPGEPVIPTGLPLSVELGPGLLSSIYDGIQRPLDIVYLQYGNWIMRGVELPGLNREKKWSFTPTVKKGDKVAGGDILGTVQETPLILHKILLPPDTPTAEIVEIYPGEYKIEDPVGKIRLLNTGEIQNIYLYHRWPVRIPRKYKRKLPPEEPLSTGQRVIDTFFPIAKGGTACIPGPFGSGKTVIQHQLSKWSDAEIIIFIGCGERGNEMADVLLEFPELKDPKTKRPLIERTVMVANTSNMPVAAREASIYTGITIGEYFRDMGYNVALMADSTSRWAEALREISGRLEEMPGEEGYPAYMATRIAEFYERAGKVVCLSSDTQPERIGTLSVIGAVSPPGGDLSDPVVQATLRVVKVFWSLEDKLAYMRHFPAISWLRSYSLYIKNIKSYLENNIDKEFPQLRSKALKILQEEATLEEIVRLVGIESLSPLERLTLLTAKSLREDFLHQIAFDPVDTYTSLYKQYRMLKIILDLHEKCVKFLSEGVPFEKIEKLEIHEEIGRMKFILEDKIEEFDKLEEKVKNLSL